MAGHHFEGVAAVEVVGVDDGEGLVDGVFCHEDGVVGAPGFLPAFGDGEASGQLVEFLEDVFHLDAPKWSALMWRLNSSSKEWRMTKTTLPKPARMASSML